MPSCIACAFPTDTASWPLSVSFLPRSRALSPATPSAPAFAIAAPRTGVWISMLLKTYERTPVTFLLSNQPLNGLIGTEVEAGNARSDGLDESVLGAAAGDDEHAWAEDYRLRIAERGESFFGQALALRVRCGFAVASALVRRFEAREATHGTARSWTSLPTV